MAIATDRRAVFGEDRLPLPNRLPLTMAIASSSVAAATITHRTGPNTSSRGDLLADATPSRIVGPTNEPGGSISLAVDLAAVDDQLGAL